MLYPYENNGAYDALKNANVISFVCGHNHRNYGDFLYNATSTKTDDKALFSFGVKATNQLYHDTDMLGYKTITLKADMTKETFLSIDNVKANFKNVTEGNTHYEN